MALPWGRYYCLQLSEVAAVLSLKLRQAIRPRRGTGVLALHSSFKTIPWSFLPKHPPVLNLAVIIYTTYDLFLLQLSARVCITPHHYMMISSSRLTVILSCFDSEWFQCPGREPFQYLSLLVPWFLLLRCLPSHSLPGSHSRNHHYQQLNSLIIPGSSLVSSSLPLVVYLQNALIPWDLQLLCNTLNNPASLLLCHTCNSG